MKTHYEVKLESQKLEVKNLQSQLKSLSDQHNLHDVFHTFEDNVARLTRENEVLRQMNLQLELQSYNHSSGGGSSDHTRRNDRGLRHTNPSPHHHHSSSNISSVDDHDNYDGDMHQYAASPIQSSSLLSSPPQQQQQQQHLQNQDHTYKYQLLKKENLRLVTKLKKISHDKDALKTDFEQLKQKERQFIVSSKINNDLSHRLRSTYQELVKVKNLYGMYDTISIFNRLSLSFLSLLSLILHHHHCYHYHYHHH